MHLGTVTGRFGLNVSTARADVSAAKVDVLTKYNSCNVAVYSMSAQALCDVCLLTWL